MDASELLCQIRLMPVVEIDDVALAVPLAHSLFEAGIQAIEITLRTIEALPAIEAVCRDLPEMLVGAGSIRHVQQFAAIRKAGAKFAVSPGATDELLAHADLPYIPGAATPSECMRLLEAGYRLQKFFPAEQNGGVKTLRAWAAPLPEVRFCPTGGIGAHNVEDYLDLDNVACVGGSWFVPREAIRAGDFEQILEMALEAQALIKRS